MAEYSRTLVGVLLKYNGLPLPPQIIEFVIFALPELKK
jgi:hypothetical protein